ncbi:MAG: ribosome-associated translation inhibitor RaiA [Bacteroidetes bacterium]|jgi:putative sigma-54 modulation protein|nr:ribosome-associated translation inhibitor RaiA [Bacteroidota bacterium]
MSIDMQAVSFRADQKLKLFIEKRVEKLNQFFDRIIHTQVLLKLENSGQIKEKVVELSVHVPGEILFVKSSKMSFEAATDEAIDSLRRQIEKYKYRRK